MLSVFFFIDMAPTEIYTLSLHDALPISIKGPRPVCKKKCRKTGPPTGSCPRPGRVAERLASEALRSEEHTSELQSHSDLVCRLLLEKKKNKGRSTPR